MSSAIERERTRLLDGHRALIGMLRGYGFQGQVTAGDSSDKQGKMGAGYNNLRRTKKKQQKWDVRKRAPAQIGMNRQRIYWRFVTR